MMDFPDEEIAVACVQGPLTLENALWMAKKANRVAPLQVLRADRVVGVDHLRSAALHARRAMQEGRNHADRLEVEFTRYAAGERQIKKAIAKMGLAGDAELAIIVALGDKRMDALRYFVDSLGLKQAEIPPADDAALAAFGITPAQRAATTAERRLDLVLEAVAAVDLMRK